MSRERKLVFYKEKDEDTIWWVDNTTQKGQHLFTFDKKEIFNLFQDYPFKLTKEQVEIFDKENPFWAHYFRKRRERWLNGEEDG